MGDNIIKCQFNLFNEGRKYTGHHRNYILESARDACNAPATQEMIGLREAYGYYGHGRRILAKQLDLTEVSVVKLPDGKSMIVENIPSNVTTLFNVGEDGAVEHHQEMLLENAPGQAAMGLHRSKIGGFSWACPGDDGGSLGVTKINGFRGFDYVLNPGFAHNRGFVLEDADDGKTRDMILENMHKAGVEEEKAEQYLDSWLTSHLLAADGLQARLDESAVLEDALREQTETQGVQITDLTSGLDTANQALEASKLAAETRRQVIMEGAKTSRIVIPEETLESIISMANGEDFGKLIGLLESARTLDMNALPGGGGNAETLPAPPGDNEPAEYGSTKFKLIGEREYSF
jgi:hypothetical protein